MNKLDLENAIELIIGSLEKIRDKILLENDLQYALFYLGGLFNFVEDFQLKTREEKDEIE